MFSETRYALNGDLRVAYRASREGPRDLMFLPNWFTCCEVCRIFPSLQGCAEGAHLERSVIMMRRLFETSCLAGMVIIGAAAQSGGFAIA